jgi:hypothetical protein
MSSSVSCAIAGSGADSRSETTLDPWFDDPFPDYDTEPVVAFSAS